MAEPAISQKIEQAMKLAASARGEDLTTLRLLKAALQNEVIARRGQGKDLAAADELAVLRRELKRRLEAAQIYEANGRPELAAKERAEAEIITRYLPKLPTAAAVEEVVRKLQAELGLSGPAATGQLIKAVMNHYQGAADGQTVSQIVRQILIQP